AVIVWDIGLSLGDKTMGFVNVFGVALRCIAGPAAVVLALFFSPQAVRADATLTPLHVFCLKDPPDCSDGSEPQSSLLMDANGNLFGTTLQGGGAGGFGTVFEITAGGKYKVLHVFCHLCSEGETPYGTLIMDVNGNLYGTTAN